MEITRSDMIRQSPPPVKRNTILSIMVPKWDLKPIPLELRLTHCSSYSKTSPPVNIFTNSINFISDINRNKTSTHIMKISPTYLEFNQQSFNTEKLLPHTAAPSFSSMDSHLHHQAQERWGIWSLSVYSTILSRYTTCVDFASLRCSYLHSRQTWRQGTWGSGSCSTCRTHTYHLLYQ